MHEICPLIEKGFSTDEMRFGMNEYEGNSWVF